MCQLSISALGVFDAALDGQSLPPFRTRKSAALLVYLAYENHAPQPRERLMHLFWPDAETRAAQTNLRQVLYHLRRGVPEVGSMDGDGHVPLVLSDRSTIQLNPAADVRFDVRRFQDLLARVRNHGHDENGRCVSCRTRLEAAAHLQQGLFLEDLQLEESAPFADWSRQVRESLRADYVDVLDRLIAFCMADGDLVAAGRWARRLVRIDELHEAGHRWLMRILAAQGLRNEALNQFAACRRLLSAELGVEPSAETGLLAQKIAEGKGWNAEPSPAQSRLPVPLTPFFGREEVLDELTRLLEERQARLVGIIGPGGVGKTRLAVRFLRQIDRHVVDGVYRVSLAGVAATAAGVTMAIADVLGLPAATEGRQGRGVVPLEERLREHLSSRHMLLLLDNFEDVITQTPLLLRLMERAPDLVLLLTSREKIPVAGAYNLRLGGLRYPREQLLPENVVDYPAAQLFLYAAQSAGLDSQIAEADLGHVAELCRLLEGQPLALELAAEWADTLSLEALLREIRRSYEVLAVDRADLDPRHRSMRTVLDATWTRLSDAEQRFFQKLCIFRGGFTRAAARAVAATEEAASAMLRLLAGLVDKSLVIHRPRDDRYVIHELLRQYGEEQLQQKRALNFQLANRHASYYADWLEEQWLRLRGADSAAAQAAIDAEFANIRHAWEWAIEQGALWILSQMASPLGWYSLWRGRLEGVEMFAAASRALESASVPEDRRRRLLAILGTREAMLRGMIGQTRQAVALLDRSRALVTAGEHGNGATRAFIELMSGRYLYESDRKAAYKHFLEALKLTGEMEDRWLVGHVHYWLGRVFHSETDFDRAEFEFQAAHDIFLALNDKRHLAETNIYQGFNAARQGRMEEAEAQMRQAEQLWVVAGNRVAVADTKRYLAPLKFWHAEIDEARRLSEESLADLQALNIQQHTPFLELSIAINAFFQGNIVDASERGSHALAVTRAAQAVREELLTLCVLGGVALLENDLPGSRRRLESAIILGRDRGMTGEGMFAESFLGFVDLAEELWAEARGRGVRILRHIIPRQAFMALSMSLPFLTALFLEVGDLADARDAWQLAANVPLARRSPLAQRLVLGRLADALAAAEDLAGPRTIEACLDAGQDLDPYPVLQSLLAKLEEMDERAAR